VLVRLRIAILEGSDQYGKGCRSDDA